MNIELQGTYCPNSANNTLVTINNTDYYFSYKTLVAVRHNGVQAIIKNYWSNTTGKHLNAIDRDKSKRLDSAAFEIVVRDMVKV